MFNYEYTKNMEDDLDKISKGNKVWHTLCSECNSQIQDLSKNLVGVERETYKIDAHHTYMIGKYGPVIKYEKGDTTTFKGVKKNINMTKLKNGEYKLEDILENKNKGSGGKLLGKYKNKDVLLKKGQYGMYINYNGKNTSIKHIKKAMDDITLSDIKDTLEGKVVSGNIIKQLNDEISIRKGKYGHYVYYKTRKNSLHNLSI